MALPAVLGGLARALGSARGLGSLLGRGAAGAGKGIIGSTQVLDLLSALNGVTGVAEILRRQFAESAKLLAQSLDDITKVDQRLALVNLGLEDAQFQNNDALRDTTGGLVDATKALAELRLLGFTKTNRNLTDLATRLKLSGQDTREMFNLAQSLLSSGGMTEDSIDVFAKQVVDLSKKFGVTGDNIVNAVNNLSSELLELNITGGAEASTRFTADLVARLGNQNAKLVGEFSKRLLSSATSQDQLALLDLEDLANDLRAGRAVDPSRVLSDIANAERRVRSLLPEGQTSGRLLQAMKPLVGEMGLITARLGEVARTRETPDLSGEDRISQLLGVVKQQLMAPFNALIVRLQPAFEKFIKDGAIFATSILNLFAKFEGIIELALKKAGDLLQVIGQTVNFVANPFDALKGLFGNEPDPEFTIVQNTIDKINKSYEVNRASQEAVSTRSVSLLEDIRTAADGSLAVDVQRLGIEERDAAIRLARESGDRGLTTYQKQSALILDRLARSIEFQKSSDELEALRQLVSDTQRIRQQAELPDASPLPGSSYRQNYNR